MSGGEGRTKTEGEDGDRESGRDPSSSLPSFLPYICHGESNSTRYTAEERVRAPIAHHDHLLCCSMKRDYVKGFRGGGSGDGDRKEDVSALPSEEGGMGTLETNGPIN